MSRQVQRPTRSERSRGSPSLRSAWAVYAVLFGLSVPWYLPKGVGPMWLGLPYWVVMSLGAYLGVALLTALVVRRFWPDKGDVGSETLGATAGPRARGEPR